MKQVLIISLSLLLVSGCSKRHVYEIEVEGYNESFIVETTINDGIIESIQAIADEETEGIGKEAIAIMCNRIIEAQSIDVDLISGATSSSIAIVEGVQKAIEKDACK